MYNVMMFDSIKGWLYMNTFETYPDAVDYAYILDRLYPNNIVEIWN